MSAASRKLQVGAKVFTDFSGRITHHTITHREEGRGSQSGILVWVQPPVPKSDGTGMCIDWFEEDK